MRDYVLATPKNASLFIARAQKLGFTELVLLAEPSIAKKLTVLREKLSKESQIHLLFGVMAQNKSQIPKNMDFDVIVKLGTIEKVVFEGLTHVIDVELDLQKDYIHQRRSGANHVLLAEYKKKGVSLLVGFASLQQATPARQAQLLGRIMQNALLCTKAGVSYTICSFAKQPLQMRHAKDISALARTLNL